MWNISLNDEKVKKILIMIFIENYCILGWELLRKPHYGSHDDASDPLYNQMKMVIARL